MAGAIKFGKHKTERRKETMKEIEKENGKGKQKERKLLLLQFPRKHGRYVLNIYDILFFIVSYTTYVI